MPKESLQLVTITMRVPVPIANILRDLAKAESRSINNYLNNLLKEVSEQKTKKSA